MLILNWMFALFLACIGVALSVNVLRCVIDDCTKFDESVEISVRHRAEEILTAFVTTVLGVHLIFHLTGVYR